MTGCPSLEMLEAFAAGGPCDGTVAAHVDRCEACRVAVKEARENNQFLAGVRRALEARAATQGKEDPRSSEPSLVSGYEMLEEIHRGGQGVVYRAIQTRTRRTVAIKMLLGGRGATHRQRERFEREVRIAAGLRHPNIVTVHDSGYVSDGQYGLVMEYIEGVPLNRWSRSLDSARGRDARRRALRERLEVMLKVCDAVLCAHQNSIVHRDLKPANILVDSAGEPHILDFGIARDTGPQERARLTYTGEFAGTLAYASPEQVSGDLSKVDTRTDIYSLGVIMYELVSGRMPYAVDGPMSQILRSIESEEPSPLPRHTRDPEGPWVDGEVSTIILKAMAKDPARRYQTAAGLRNDISRYLSGDAIEARRDSTWYVLRKTAARHRVVVTAAALFFVLLAAFGAAMTWQAHRLEVRGRELATALSASNVERGRSLAAAGSIPLAEETVFPELIRAGVTRIDGPEAGFTGSPESMHAYWALWDVFRSSPRLATLRSTGKQIELLYFDQGGQRLNSLDSSGRLISWSIATWEPVRDTRLIAPIEGVAFRAALAPGEKIAVFGGGVIRVIDPETSAVAAQSDDPDNQAVTGAFSPDGTLLATIGRDDLLRLRDARSLESVATIAESTVCGIAPYFCRPTFSLDGRLVAAARPGGSLGLWNTASGALELALPPPDSLARYARNKWSRTIAFGTDGAIAASLGFHLVVWPADGRPPLDLGVSGGQIGAVAFLPGSEGRMLVSSGMTPGGGGGVTTIWNLATGGRVARFDHGAEAIACAVSPDAGLIAAGEDTGTVQVNEAAPEPHVTVLHDGGLRGGGGTALSPDGRVVALITATDGEAGRDVLLMDLKSRTRISRFHQEGDPNTLRGLAFAPDGLSLFEGERGRLMQCDVTSGSAVREFAFPDPNGPGASRRHREPVKPRYSTGGLSQVRLSPDGSILAQARNDGLIGLWDASSGRWIDWLDGGPAELAVIDFSPDGRALVAHHPDQCVLWDIETRRPKRTIATDEALPTVRFSPDGVVLALGTGGRIQFVDAGTGRVLSENRDPRSAGMAMVFHPGGSVLFASAWDSSIRLWDTRTGRELLSLQKHTALIRSLLLTPDGNTLISSDVSGTVLVWDLTYYNRHIRRELEYRVTHPAKQ